MSLIVGAIKWVGLAGPVVKKSQGYFTPSSEIDLIKSSIQMILGTSIGERVMNPEFGSRLREVPFNQVDAATDLLIENYVIEAVSRWEPRVEITGFDIQHDDDNQIRVKIYFNKLDIPIQSFDIDFILEAA
jgi:phage baseplate assembly protein W